MSESYSTEAPRKYVGVRVTWSYQAHTGVYEEPATTHRTWIREDGTLDDWNWRDHACDCELGPLFGIGVLPCGDEITVTKIERI